MEAWQKFTISTLGANGLIRKEEMSFLKGIRNYSECAFPGIL
jgi:hypothetical protein